MHNIRQHPLVEGVKKVNFNSKIPSRGFGVAPLSINLHFANGGDTRLTS